MSPTSQYDLDRLRASADVRAIEHHTEIGSTNDRALELAGQPDAELPFLIVADRQTAGRGRGANRWWAGDGAFTFSLAIESSAASIPTHRWPQLSLTTGLAICETLEDLTSSSDAQVKWPNDVYLLGRKICGILIESPTIRDRLVIGVGLNVNNSFRDAPAELQGTAISLVDYDGQVRDMTDVLITVLDRIAKRWNDLAERGFATLIDEWRPRSYLTGRAVQVVAGPQTVIGRCTGIDDDGALVVQTENGPRTCHAGSVTCLD